MAAGERAENHVRVGGVGGPQKRVARQPRPWRIGTTRSRGTGTLATRYLYMSVCCSSSSYCAGRRCERHHRPRDWRRVWLPRFERGRELDLHRRRTARSPVPRLARQDPPVPRHHAWRSRHDGRGKETDACVASLSGSRLDLGTATGRGLGRRASATASVGALLLRSRRALELAGVAGAAYPLLAPSDGQPLPGWRLCSRHALEKK